MSEDNFEIVTKKEDELETYDNDSSTSKNTTSLITNSVPPPSALPTFVTSSANESLSSNVFHPAPFCPEIPENKNEFNSPILEGTAETEFESLSAVGSSLFGWVKDTVGTKGSSLLNKVAEKAKSSMDSVITTLDPQMKDFISNSNGLCIVVASEREVEVSPIREAFQSVFNQVFVRGFEAEDLCIPKQVVGFDAANTVALMKIEAIQKQQPINCPIIVVQNFVANISDDKWYDLDLLILHETEKNLHLETYSQMIPVPKTIVNIVKEDTPEDYKLLNLGYNVAVSQIMGTNLQVHPLEWQETLTGVTRRQRILSAAKVIANLYKNTLL